jgi:glycosyltransferase involved in cell wall biosynthesis
MTQKIKVLMISDMQLSTSGVGTQSRVLINGLLSTGRYTFRCLGAALKHEDMRTIVVNDDFVIKPINGFGDPNLIRQVLVSEKPDVLLLFTDPRFFMHVFAHEDEVHQICPIAYNNLWDNFPAPTFNKPLYKSCDLLNCINWVSYSFLKEWGFENVHYTPHAVPEDVYFPMSDVDAKNAKLAFFGPARVDHFMPLFVGRNARRKNTGDIVCSFKMFLDELEKKYGHRKSTLVMHTDPFDQEGPNLQAVVDLYNVKDNVVFSNNRVGFNQMNALYNACDVGINKSSAEGLGLPILEIKMTGKPIICLKTGGLTKQVEDDVTGEQYGVAIEPEVKTLVGTQQISFIFDDACSNETFAKALMTVYEMGEEKRKELGNRAMLHARKNYSMQHLISTWDETLTKLVDDWKHKRLPNNKRWEAITL